MELKTYDSQTTEPAIVLTKTDQEIAVVPVEGICEELGTSTDVEVLTSMTKVRIKCQCYDRYTHDIPAVSAGCTTTLLFGDLHEALFTSTADGVRVARTLLHGKRSQHDGRNAELPSVLLKQVSELAAGMERAVAVAEGFPEGHHDNVFDADVGWPPTAIVDPAVQPVDATIGTGGLRGLLCKSIQHQESVF